MLALYCNPANQVQTQPQSTHRFIPLRSTKGIPAMVEVKRKTIVFKGVMVGIGAAPSPILVVVADERETLRLLSSVDDHFTLYPDLVIWMLEWPLDTSRTMLAHPSLSCEIDYACCLQTHVLIRSSATYHSYAHVN